MQINHEINIDDYIDSYVVFLDILGYKNIFKLLDNKDFHDYNGINRKDTFGKIARLNSVLRAESRFIANKENHGIENINMTFVSDSIIISIPKDNNNLMLLLAEIINIQYGLLLSDGLLIRGYLASGDVYHKNGYIFGSGYIEAYEGEKRASQNNLSGIVILSQDVLNDIKEYDKQTNELKIFDTYTKENWINNDSLNYFVDFLNPNILEAAYYQGQHDLFLEHKNNLKNYVSMQPQNYANYPRISAKWEWLKKYFETLDKYFEIKLLY